ncbi:MAG: hypothetical protein VX246_04280 [Myxococcota bacterium]|nr:hypothetical protein [Myxococcota bacterium]
MSEPTNPRETDATTELNWIRVQAASGLIFSIFLAIHLANTMLGSAGSETFDAFQSSSRSFYQNPFFELIVVLIPLAVHMTASLVRILRRRRRNLSKPPLRLRLHRYSGWFLLAVITGHVSATRGVGFFFDAPAGFGALNLSLVFAPYLFVPYYILLGSCGSYHLWNGLSIATRVFGVRLPNALTRGPGFWIPVGGAVLAIFVAVLSLWGMFFEVDRELWGEFGRVFAEFTGADLNEL